MLVYRIEHAVTGGGPYNPGYLPDDEARKKHANLGTRDRYWERKGEQPTPEVDGLAHLGNVWTFPKHLHFGFASIDDLFAWFGEGYVERAAEADFVTAVYYVPFGDVHFGGHQVAFPRGDAHLVRQCRTLDELRNLFPLRKEATA